MRPNLLSEEWADVDSAELRILLDQRIGGPGQIQGRADYPSKFYLPLAGESCRIALTFRDKKLVAIQPGPAFDAAEWERITARVREMGVPILQELPIVLGATGAGPCQYILDPDGIEIEIKRA